MYDQSYGPEFLARPDSVEELKFEGGIYDLEIRTHCPEDGDGPDCIILFRLCDPERCWSPMAVGAYHLYRGAIFWHSYQDEPGFSKAGFHEEFVEHARQLSRDMGFS